MKLSNYVPRLASRADTPKLILLHSLNHSSVTILIECIYGCKKNTIALFINFIKCFQTDILSCLKNNTNLIMNYIAYQI